MNAAAVGRFVTEHLRCRARITARLVASSGNEIALSCSACDATLVLAMSRRLDEAALATLNDDLTAACATLLFEVSEAEQEFRERLYRLGVLEGKPPKAEH